MQDLYTGVEYVALSYTYTCTSRVLRPLENVQLL